MNVAASHRLGQRYLPTFVVLLLIAVYPQAIAEAGGTNNANELAQQKLQAKSIADAMTEGGRLYQEKKYVQAAKTYRKVIHLDPEHGQAWYQLGMSLHSDGKIDEAVVAHIFAAQFQRSPANAMYSAGCAYALLNKKEKALQWLYRALSKSNNGLSVALTDSDLTSLKDDPRFDRFLSLATKPRGGGIQPGTTCRVTTTISRTKGSAGGVAVDTSGNIFVGDFRNKLYKVTSDGQWTVIASDLRVAAGNTFDSKGNLFQVNHRDSTVTKFSPDGAASNFPINGLIKPVGITADRNDNLLITNYRNNSIMKVAPSGDSVVLLKGGFLNGPNGITTDDNDKIYVVNYNDGVILQIDQSGLAHYLAELPTEGNGHIAFANGRLYVTARLSHQIYEVSLEGEIRMLAGSGGKGSLDGQGADATFSLPNGIAASPSGDKLYINELLRTPGSSESYWILRTIELTRKPPSQKG